MPRGLDETGPKNRSRAVSAKRGQAPNGTGVTKVGRKRFDSVSTSPGSEPSSEDDGSSNRRPKDEEDPERPPDSSGSDSEETGFSTRGDITKSELTLDTGGRPKSSVNGKSKLHATKPTTTSTVKSTSGAVGEDRCNKRPKRTSAKDEESTSIAKKFKTSDSVSGLGAHFSKRLEQGTAKKGKTFSQKYKLIQDEQTEEISPEENSPVQRIWNPGSRGKGRDATVSPTLELKLPQGIVPGLRKSQKRDIGKTEPNSPMKNLVPPGSTSPIKDGTGLPDRNRRQSWRERKARKESPIKQASPDSPDHKFVIPDMISSDFPLEEDDLEDETQEALDIPILSPSDDATCPLCGVAVKKDLLSDFVKHQKHLNFVQKRRFCKLHKLDSARDTWKNKGYPDIDWQHLESRIAEHGDVLRGILLGRSSYFREEFSKKVKSGQAKNISNIIKSDQSLTPGYYGSRGLSFMSNAIIKEFSSLLRERAVQDRLISARGYTAYVQSVLVPELTVELIKEDMSVDSDEARKILQTSISEGELMHEDVRDVVKDDEDSGSDSPLSPLTDIDLIESD